MGLMDLIPSVRRAIQVSPLWFVICDASGSVAIERAREAALGRYPACALDRLCGSTDDRYLYGAAQSDEPHSGRICARSRGDVVDERTCAAIVHGRREPLFLARPACGWRDGEHLWGAIPECRDILECGPCLCADHCGCFHHLGHERDSHRRE